MSRQNKKYFIGVGINLFDARAILLDENNKIITHIQENRSQEGINEILKLILELCEKIIKKVKRYKNDIAAVGIAAGGIVNHHKGVVYWPIRKSLYYSYVSIPLKDYVEKKFSLPVSLENDANAAVYAEYKINFPKKENIVYMFSGVGCGLILNSEIYRGRDGAAGELFINPQEPMRSLLGDASFLRQWQYDLGITSYIKEEISSGKSSLLLKKISSLGEIKLYDIFSAANRNDKLALVAVRKAAFTLGVKISFLVNLLNPEVVIIGGGLEEAGDIFLNECLKAVNKFSFNEMAKKLLLVRSILGKEAVAIGAALTAKDNLFK